MIEDDALLFPSTTIDNISVNDYQASQNQAQITAFAFVGYAAYPGVINQNTGTIAVTLPYGTSVTAIVAAFTVSNGSVKVGSAVQVSGVTANDFTSPVVYTTVGQGGSTKQYTVSVTLALNTSKSITTFSFKNYEPYAAAIDDAAGKIVVGLPHNTPVTGLIAQFSTTGANVAVGSVSQVSGTTANDFTNPVTYVVVAADGSTKNYVVTVTVAPNTIYTAGTLDVPNSTVSIACYWVDYNENDLPHNLWQSYANAITVSGGIIYTAGSSGYSSGNPVASYWTSAAGQDLPGSNGIARSIAVVGGTVYTSGSYTNTGVSVPCYWVGTAKQDLAPNGGAANSIAVVGSTIYTAGYYLNISNNNPCYWVGTAKQDLPGGTGVANSIAVVGGTIYTAGYYLNAGHYTPCYWVGTTKYDLLV